MAVRDQLAEFCSNLKFEDLPSDVVEFTRLLLMDEIGVTIAGSRKEEGIAIAKFFREMGGKEESSLVGDGSKVPCINAAFSNTVSGHGGDAMHRSAIHLCSLIPATVAVAEKQSASGKDLILATVIGCEIIARVGLALRANHVYDRGFHPTSLSAPFGCAAASSKLLGLGREGIGEALSIAALQGAGARPWPQTPKSSTGALQVGRAAQGGVMSALLAQMGVLGIRDILEHPAGFLTGHSASPDVTRLTEGLGTVWEVKQITLKRFSVGIYVIPGVEALLELLRETRVQAEDIAGMTFRLPGAVIPLVGSPNYPLGGTPNINSRYVLAVTAYRGEEGMLVTQEYASDANLADPRHKELFKRIDVVAEPELDRFFPGKWPCILTIRTKDGREFTRFHDKPMKGEPENPFTAGEVEAKFTKLVLSVLGKAKCNALLDVIGELLSVKDVAQLASLMASK